MSESNIPLEDQMRDPATDVGVDREFIQPKPDYHEDEAVKLEMANMSLEQSNAKTTEDSSVKYTVIDTEKVMTSLDPLMKVQELNNSAMQQLEHFQESGDCAAIDSAVQLFGEAVKLIPDGHASKASMLNNLGNAFQSRFNCLGMLEDIGNAICFLQQAVDLTPKGHADKAHQFNNLGNAFQSRFEHLGELGDIENAICFKQQAVDLTPNDHASKASLLNNLGNAFQSRFECLGEPEDIEHAIRFKQQAVDLTADGHASKASQLANLGIASTHQFENLGELGDILKASVAFQQATKNTSSPPSVRYEAACRWATLSSHYQGSSSALDAYKMVLEIIPQLFWLGQTVHQRCKELPKIGRTINAAVATAISAGNLTQAVEWLEEGRGIFWGQIVQLRLPLDDLHDQHPSLAQHLETISSALQNADTQLEAYQRTQWAAEYEALIAQVRKLDGFDSFLKPKKLSDFIPAAENGPIIIINVDQSRCDALVLSSSHDIIHIPLPNFLSKQAEELHSGLVSSLQANDVGGDRDDSVHGHDHFKSILARLWSTVVQPILSEIEDVLCDYSAEHNLPHITWCATGALAFLPLHAAGIYGSKDPSDDIKLSDFVVSSYTTTLSAMINSGHSKIQQNPREKPNILIISQPATPNLPPLPGTKEEARIIQTRTSPEHSCHLTHDEAVVETVKAEMSKYQIIHLACHAIQDSKNPLDSAFALYDGRLKLHDLMGLSIQNVELAVLSASDTAAGDEKLPEEAFHLAAGMLAVGYPSVIATMWSIGEKEPCILADKFYESFLGHRDEMVVRNPRQSAAYALHVVVEHLRKEVGEMEFKKWVPFVHYGV